MDISNIPCGNFLSNLHKNRELATESEAALDILSAMDAQLLETPNGLFWYLQKGQQM